MATRRPSVLPGLDAAPSATDENVGGGRKRGSLIFAKKRKAPSCSTAANLAKAMQHEVEMETMDTPANYAAAEYNAAHSGLEQLQGKAGWFGFARAGLCALGALRARGAVLARGCARAGKTPDLVTRTGVPSSQNRERSRRAAPRRFTSF